MNDLKKFLKDAYIARIMYVCLLLREIDHEHFPDEDETFSFLIEEYVKEEIRNCYKIEAKSLQRQEHERRFLKKKDYSDVINDNSCLLGAFHFSTRFYAKLACEKKYIDEEIGSFARTLASQIDKVISKGEGPTSNTERGMVDENYFPTL